MSRKSPFSEEIEKFISKNTEIVSSEKPQKFNFSFDYKKINTKYLGIGVTVLLFVFLYIFRKKYLYDKEEKRYSYSKIIIFLLLGSIPAIITYYL